MKKAAYISFFFVVILLMSSCSSTYFYSTLNSTNERVEKVENGDFLYENDSLWIAHCFKGEDAPIQITVYNKLDVPLYVDWSKSALVINDEAFSYSGKTASFAGQADRNYYSNMSSSGYYYDRMEITGSAELPQYVSFLPPRTKTTYEALRIAARFDEIKDKEYAKKIKIGTTNGIVDYAKAIDYSTDNTPLHFKSYVTTYTSPDKLSFHDFEFYVNKLIKTKIAPNNLPANMAERGDIFYQHKRPDNTGWYILGTVGVSAGIAAVDVFVLNKD